MGFLLGSAQWSRNSSKKEDILSLFCSPWTSFTPLCGRGADIREAVPSLNGS